MLASSTSMLVTCSPSSIVTLKSRGIIGDSSASKIFFLDWCFLVTIAAPAVLFIGCRSQTADRLYAAEIDAWERIGVVSRKEIVELWKADARVYVCGSGGFVKSLGEVTRNIVSEVAQGNPQMMAGMEERMKAKFVERCAMDVFG
ncbi:hypothetical protein BGZ60DRAFT_416117 [Tricladium varicosporioides]|nr:hypothetical protein BGZ60DRAFT_416117 [Hymenoscyphus varicosporioides]